MKSARLLAALGAMVTFLGVVAARAADELYEWTLRRPVVITRGARGCLVLAAWDELLPHFVKVMPKDYRRALDCLARVHEQGLTGDEAVMAAFEENARDLARVGGN